MARSFNGSSDNLPWASPANLLGSALTFSVWVYIDTLDGTIRRVISTSSSANGEAVGFGVSNRRVQFFRSGTFAMTMDGYTDMYPKTGEWINIICTHTGSSLANDTKIYFNGIEATTYANNVNGSGYRASDGYFTLGARKTDSTRFFDGVMSDVGVWNRVLTADEIAGLAAGLSPLYYKNSLIFAPTLLGYDAEPDPISGLVATHDGTTVADHPRIIYPSDMFGVYTPAAAGGPLILEFNDSLTLSDSVGALAQYQVDLSESLYTSEGLNSLANYKVSLPDSLSVVENLEQRASYKVALSEALSIAESLVQRVRYKISLTETMSFLESVGARVSYKLGLSDRVSLSESIRGIASYLVRVNDSLRATETLAEVGRNIRSRFNKVMGRFNRL